MFCRIFLSAEALVVSSFLLALIPPVFHEQINMALSANPRLTVVVMVVAIALLILWAFGQWCAVRSKTTIAR